MPRFVSALLVSIALLALPAAAQAATPFTAGSGTEPSVAVGSDGTGHVVWLTTGSNDQVGYCRVAVGGGACNRTELLNFGVATAANETGRPRVFTPAPNKVVIVAGCWNCPDGSGNKVFRWISNDNGATFPGGAVQIGEIFAVNGFGTWLDDVAGGTFVAVNANQAMAAALPAVGSAVPYAPVSYAYGPEVVRVPGTAKLVAATNNLDVVQYGVFDGAPATPLGINTAANWTKNISLSSPEADNSETALNAGPNGVALTYKSSAPGSARVGLRRFNSTGNTLGAATYVEGGDPIDTNGLDHPDSFQDASGRIHLVWRSLHGGGRLRYRVSDTAGASFSAAANLAKSESFTQPEVAAGSNGKGFATWTPGATGAIRIVALDPQPETTGTSPGASPTITGARIGDRTLRPGQATTFRFRSSGAGKAVLTFEKRVKGLKVKTKRKGKKAKTSCAARTKKRLRALRKKAGGKRAYRKLLKKRSCKRWARIGRIRQAVQPGENSIAFNGRIAGRKLTKGQYRGRLVITSSAGAVSRVETIKFKVTAKKKRAKKRR